MQHTVTLEEVIETLRSAAARLSDDQRSVVSRYVRSTCLPLLRVRGRVHPLGFFYVDEVVDEKTKLRCHVWSTELRISEDQKTGEIHDHVYALTSTIVAGELRNETFEFTESPGGTCVAAEIEYGGSTSSAIASSQRGDIKPILDDRYAAGMCYRVPAGIIHRASPSVRPCVTLVLQDEIRPADRPKVFSIGGEVPPPFDRRSITQAEIDQVMRIIGAT